MEILGRGKAALDIYSIKQHQEQSHTMPSGREKLVMIAMNAALEDVYKKVFADSYQHGAPLEGRENAVETLTE